MIEHKVMTENLTIIFVVNIVEIPLT